MSREYIFDKLGPVVIGSDEKCDLVLNDTQIERRLLEVKVSAGQILIKELGAKAEIYLDSVILPFRLETPYHEGSCITLKNTNYQVYIHKNEAVEPPPFFTDEFKTKLDDLGHRIKEKQNELSEIYREIDKGKGEILSIERSAHVLRVDRDKMDREVNLLQKDREFLDKEMKRSVDKNKEEQDKAKGLSDKIEHLQLENLEIQNSINKRRNFFDKLKTEVDEKIKDVSVHEGRLSALKLEINKSQEMVQGLIFEREEREKEIQSEKNKIQNALSENEKVVGNSLKLQEKLMTLSREKENLAIEVYGLQEQLTKFQQTRAEAEARIHETRGLHQREEMVLNNLKSEIADHVQKEQALRLSVEEVRSKLIGLEDKVTHKANVLNSLEFKSEQAITKYNDIEIEIDRAQKRQAELLLKEHDQEQKLRVAKDSFKMFVDQMEKDRKKMTQEFDDNAQALQTNVNNLKNEISRLEVESEVKKDQLKKTKSDLADSEIKTQGLLKNKNDLEMHVIALESKIHETEKKYSALNQDKDNLSHQKSLLQTDLAVLKNKLTEVEDTIRQREQEAYLTLENMKREEKSKMLAEKSVLLSEVEAIKQRGLLELDETYQKKMEEVYHEKTEVHQKASQILKDAHLEAQNIISSAREAEKKVSNESMMREGQAYAALQEAQKFFREKEVEADEIIKKAKSQALQESRDTHVALLEDLDKRKKKIKQFLNYKQEKGQLAIKHSREQNLVFIKRQQEKAFSQIEVLKRKELKKVALIREEELARVKELQESVLSLTQKEKEKAFIELSSLRKKQENELANTKKAVLDGINQMKIQQQELWQRELQEEKDDYQRTKRQRVKSASQAVMNALITQLGGRPELSGDFEKRLETSLEVAINGQDPLVMQDVEQVLDFNPAKKKHFAPVVKKYAIRFALPVAIAVVFMADIGSIRTGLISYSKDLIKQKESASDKFVQNKKEEWKEKYTYNPEMTVGYKDTFADNILYTKDFIAVMENEAFQNEWILKVNDFLVKDLELSEDVAISYISSEGALLKELAQARNEIVPQFKDQGIKKLQDIEKNQLGWLSEKITDSAKAQKFLEFRRNYFNDYYQNKYLSNRDVASEKKETVTE